MTDDNVKVETAESLIAENTVQQLRALAKKRGVSGAGSKLDIVERLISQPERVSDAPAVEPEPDEPTRDDTEPEDPIDEAPEASTPEGLKPPKVKQESDGSRTATVKREMTYIDLAAEVGYVGSPRELAAFNGVRNGRLELHPGDKVTIPAPYDPRG